MATIIVKSKSELGFRRCGIKFTREPKTLVEGTDITAEQLKLLKAEPNLIVETIGETGKKPPTAEDLIAKIGECKTIDEVKPFFKDETRVTVINAAKAKIAALKDIMKSGG